VTGSAAASAATEDGQPRTTPLWLNRKPAFGERRRRGRGDRHADGRRAHRGEHAAEVVARARSANTPSDQSGEALR
jgi:hypothetical protein